VSRIILELGLNRKVVLDRSFPDIKSRVQAINTMWTVFVLEQHLSYALGFSNAMPNLRLESTFPQPVSLSLSVHSCFQVRAPVSSSLIPLRRSTPHF
jgi:hypothetical protein